MLIDTLGITDGKRGGIDETDPGAGTIATLQVGQQRQQHSGNEGDKAGIADQMRKVLGEMHLHMFGVIRFEGALVRLVKVDQNGHHLTGT